MIDISIAILALICYTSMEFIATAAFGSRTAGKLTNNLSLGTTLEQTIFMISRLFMPPLLLSLSFLIESGLRIQTFLLAAIILTTSAFFICLLVLVFFNFFQLLFQELFLNYKTNSIPIAIIKLIFNRKEKFKGVNIACYPKTSSLHLKKIAVSCAANFFISTGFLAAFSLAIIIPDYKMTMSQLTTAITGIGALILTVYIDPMISRSIDVRSENSVWLENVYSILIGKVLSYFIAAIVFLNLYLYYLT